MAEILDGRKIAAGICAEVEQKVERLKNQGTVPTLAIVVATKDEAALAYVRAIVKAADSVGIKVKKIELGANATFGRMSLVLQAVAADQKVHGIILQTPLPVGIDADKLRALIPPAKDIDGASPLSVGRLVSGLPTFAPATAAAVMEMFEQYKVPLEGNRAVVIGRSRVVGKPLAHLLLDANATVTICHSKTKDLARVARAADTVIVAIGKPNFVNAEFIKDGATVIDIGTNVSSSGKVVGDVDAKSVAQKARLISPVPGGVGPVTTAVLLKHTVLAAGNKYVL